MFSCEFCEISKNTFFTELLRVTTPKQVTVPLQCLQMAKLLIISSRRTGETILSNYWQNPKITAAVHCFHYNSHHHYHYYHFHYHCKMHLYHLKILLTILFIVKWSRLFQQHFVFFSLVCIFLLLYYTFPFLCPVKGVN